MSDSPLDVLIVGAGFSGICAAIQLKRAGITKILMVDQSRELGGTWQANIYPGAACDVESHVYSFSFEPWPYWSHTFARQPEIFAYMRHCAAKYDLHPHMRLGTRITRAAFDPSAGLWTVWGIDQQNNSQEWTARALISAVGGLSRPVWPQVSGLKDFGGPAFHTARWDYSVDLSKARVGVIGTGASAIQVIPAIADRVRHLTVFQRTPPWILPRPDRPIPPAERRLYALFPWLQRLQRARLYCGLEAHAIPFIHQPALMRVAQGWAADWLDVCVPDPSLKKLLTPNYSIGCKRILLSNDYYKTLQRPNVSLVPHGVTQITPTGALDAAQTHHDLDALIFATGFDAAESLSPFAITGLDGADLNQQWAASGAEAFKGTTVSGFPNLFFLMGPNTALGHNSVIIMIEAQTRYAVAAIKTLLDNNLRSINLRPEPQRAYNDALQRKLDRTVWASGCKSWYRTSTGKNTTLWPGFTWTFALQTRRFDPQHYDLK